MNNEKWSKTVILVDADYVDKVAFDLIVNFERMLGRRIPQADMAQWLEYVALDGGLRPTSSTNIPRTETPHSQGENTTLANSPHPAPSTQVVLMHKKAQMDNFLPGVFSDLDGKAFTGQLGEFLISCVPVEESVPHADHQVRELATMEALFIDSLQVLANAEEVNRLIVVPDSEHIYNKVREALRQVNPDKHVTVLSMQPMPNGQFRQEILGYSLMAALGIRADEINRQQ